MIGALIMFGTIAMKSVQVFYYAAERNKRTEKIEKIRKDISNYKKEGGK